MLIIVSYTYSWAHEMERCRYNERFTYIQHAHVYNTHMLTPAMSIGIYTILYYTILYYTILHYTILYYTDVDRYRYWLIITTGAEKGCEKDSKFM